MTKAGDDDIIIARGKWQRVLLKDRNSATALEVTWTKKIAQGVEMTTVQTRHILEWFPRLELSAEPIAQMRTPGLHQHIF